MPVKIGIIVLNYNNALDTCHAIGSIVNNQNSNSHSLVVVDNKSTDNSYEEIKKFIENNFKLNEFGNGQAINNIVPFLPHVNLIVANQNNGFATGNNLGIIFFLQDDSFTHFWVLNNDVELKVDCIRKIEEELEKNINNNIGVFTTLLANFNNRSKLQALGGYYNVFLAKTKLIFPNFLINELSDELIDINEKKINYFIGASLIFTRNFVNKVGLLNEKYFLYAEEIDICLRAKKSNFSKKIIRDAIVYHKEGGSTNHNKKTINLFIEFHNIRSKLIFTRLYYSYYYYLAFILLLMYYSILFKGNIIKASQLLFKAIK